MFFKYGNFLYRSGESVFAVLYRLYKPWLARRKLDGEP
jgi:hypothetical protein